MERKRQSLAPLILLTGVLGLALSACVTRRTVRDASGNVILKETKVTRPFQSDASRARKAREDAYRLGVY